MLNKGLRAASRVFGVGTGRNVLLPNRRLRWLEIPRSHYVTAFAGRLYGTTTVRDYGGAHVREEKRGECPIDDQFVAYILTVRKRKLIEVSAFGNPEYTEDLSEIRKQLTECHRYYSDVVEKNRISAALLIHGYLPESICLRSVLIERGIKAASFEKTGRADRLLWDNLSLLPVNKNLAANHYWRYEKEVDGESASAFWQESLEDIGRNKRPEHVAGSETGFEKKCRGPLFLFLGQVLTDASIVFGIGAYRTPVEILKEVCATAEKENGRVLVKLHPKETTQLGDPIYGQPYDKATYRLCMSDSTLKAYVEAGLLELDHTNRYNTYELIRNADVVVTLNSQAGLEAAAMSKPVVCCGHSFYSGLGATLDAMHPSLLSAALSHALTAGASNAEIARKIYYIFYEKYCIPFEVNHIVTKVLHR